MDIPDWAVLQDFAGGDDSAFTRIYEAYKRPLFTFCCRMLKDEEESKDIVQDVFTMLYRRPPAPDPRARLKSWLFTVARNGCLKSLRRGKLDGDGELAMVQSGDLPHEQTEFAERTRIVQHALARLSPEYRDVIVLREWGGMNYEEISEILHLSIPAVRARLFKARKQIGLLLHASYGEECHEL